MSGAMTKALEAIRRVGEVTWDRTPEPSVCKCAAWGSGSYTPIHPNTMMALERRGLVERVLESFDMVIWKPKAEGGAS